MNTQTYLPEETVIRQAIEALMRALGPVETVRFLKMTHQLSVDSVEWHRQWQASLDRSEFFDEVFETNSGD